MSKYDTYNELKTLAFGNGAFPLVAKALLANDEGKMFKELVSTDKNAVTHALSDLLAMENGLKKLGSFKATGYDIKSGLSGTSKGDLGHVATANARADKIYQPIQALLEKWNNLSSVTKAFLNNFFVLIDGVGSTVSWNNFSSATRLNLRKDKGNTSATDFKDTVLYQTLDEYTNASTDLNATQVDRQGKVDDVEYEGKTVGDIADIDELFSKSNPLSVPVTIPAYVAGILSNKLPKHFGSGAKINDFIRRILASPPKRATQAADVSSGLVDFSMGGEVYVRNGAGQLVRNEPDGRQVVLGDKNTSAADENLTIAPTCFGAGLTGIKEDQCVDFVFECLIDEDPSKLSKCLTGYYDKYMNPEERLREDVGKMHPMVAYRTLQKFGFRMRSVPDAAAGTHLNKVEGVDTWEEHITKNDADRKGAWGASSRQAQLRTYLQMVVDYVNANPAILNEHYTGSSQEATGLFKSNPTFDAMNVPASKPHPQGTAHQLQNVLANRHRLSVLDSNTWMNQLSPFGISVSGNIHPQVVSMSGGALEVRDIPQSGGGQVGDLAVSVDKAHTSGAYYLSNIFKGLLAQLEVRGKTITSKDKDYINRKLNELVSEEQDMFRIVDYIERYAHLLDFMEGEAGADDVLSFDALKQMVDKKSHLEGSQRNTEGKLNKILVAVQKLVDDGSSDGKMRPL